jgi:hypothetical protein
MLKFGLPLAYVALSARAARADNHGLHDLA